MFSPLFYFIFVLFYWHVPPPLPLAIYLLHTGKLVVHGPTFIFYIFLLFFSFFFTSHSAQRGAGGSTICSDSCFLYFIALLTLGGPFYFGIPFIGTLACDHGNWPSQVLD